MNDAKINARQLAILVAYFSIGSTILVVPSGMAEMAHQDAWIAALLGIGFGLLLVALYGALGRKYPGLTLIEMNRKLLGKWLGTLVSATFVFFSLYNAGTLLFYYGNFITTQIMRDTPMIAVYILFTCTVVMGLRLGLETMARAGELLFPWFLFLLSILVVFISPEIKFTNIQPAFETGYKSIIHATWEFTSFFSMPLVVFLMIYPASVNDAAQARKAFLVGTMIGGVVLLLIITLTILVLSADMAARLSFPSYALAKKINVGNFLQRIEAVMAIIWVITLYYRMKIYFFSAVRGLSQLLQLKDERLIVLPLGMIMTVIPIIILPDIVYSDLFDKHIWPPYVATYGILLPLFLLSLSFIRKKRE